MGAVVLVDETKQRGYQLVAVHAPTPRALGDMRRMIRGLVLGGQRRIHMTKESDPRRRTIADLVAGMPVSAVVYDAGRRYPYELDARQACLSALMEDAVAASARMLILERDDSLLRWDLQRLIELTRTHGCRDQLLYEHRRAIEEPALAVPDAIAWCWAKGGDWRRRVAPVVSHVRKV